MITNMMRRAMISGDGSTLSLDFTTGVLDPRLTFTRSTSGTYIGADGLVKTATANTPRFDYDPSTLQPRGLLIEGSANNLCEQGQYCWGTGATKIWVRSAGINVNSVNGSGGANIIARIDGPDGGSLTGTSVVKDAGLSFVRFNVDVTVAASTTYTFSAYVRAPSGGNPYMRLAAFNGGTWLATTGGTTASGITITDTANTGSRFNGVSSTAWVRVWVTFTTQAGQTAATIAFYPDTDTTNTATMYVWGAQVETGSGPSSLIPTGASTGSRAFDSCVMDNITSLQYSTTNGSMYYEGRFSQLNTSSFPWRMGFTNEPAPDARVFGFLTNSGGSAVEAKGPGATPTANVGTPIALNTDYKLAWSMDTALLTGEVRRSSNGGAVSVSGATAMTITGTPTYFMFGQKGYGLWFPAGTIKAAKYWPTTLSDAQLQAITT